MPVRWFLFPVMDENAAPGLRNEDAEDSSPRIPEYKRQLLTNGILAYWGFRPGHILIPKISSSL
jgi:hypothetical protein